MRHRRATASESVDSKLDIMVLAAVASANCCQYSAYSLAQSVGLSGVGPWIRWIGWYPYSRVQYIVAVLDEYRRVP
jgi:hypothetical protein